MPLKQPHKIMDTIKELFSSLSVTLVITVILSLLTPRGTIGNTYRIVMSLFIFTSFLIPLSNADFSDFTLGYNIFSVEELEQSNAEVYEELINNQILSLLKENAVDSAIADSSIKMEGEEITVEKIIVYIPDQYDSNEVKNIIFDQLGYVCEVEYIGI